LQVIGDILVGDLSGVTGSANSPLIQINDINTGLFDGGVNVLGFSTNGNEVMRIDGDGNVGIGTTSPAAPLTVSKNDGTGNTKILVSGTNMHGRVDVDVTNSSTYIPSFNLLANNTETGRLLLGRSSPVITGTVQDDLILAGVLSGTQKLHLATNSTSRLTIDNNGNLGIGTTSPTVLLTVGSTTPDQIAAANYYNSAFVAGDLEVDGTLYAGSFTPTGLGTDMLVTTDSSGALTSSSTPTHLNHCHFYIRGRADNRNNWVCV